MSNILSIRNLTVWYRDADAPAVSDFSMDVPEWSVVAIVGDSGGGKSTVVRAVMGLLSGGGRIAEGEIRFRGRNLVDLPEREYRKLRGDQIAMIFQNAGDALDPRKKIGAQYAEALRAHGKVSRKQAREMGLDMLARMALPDPERILKSYPFELSGGMAQRAAIAMSLSTRCDLLLADEPTSALDVTTQAQAVREILRLRDERGASVILVTHNLGVAAYMADFIAVMRDGRLAEWGPAEQILNRPQSDCARKLVAAARDMDMDTSDATASNMEASVIEASDMKTSNRKASVIETSDMEASTAETPGTEASENGGDGI